MYGAINKYYTTTNIFYFIKVVSDAYNLQINTTIFVEVIYDGELVFKA